MKKTIVNYQLLLFLFACSTLLHVLAVAAYPSHPHLGTLLALLEIVGWSCILAIWGMALTRGIQSWVPKLWAKVWMLIRMHGRSKKAKNKQRVVPIEQLKQLHNDIQHLELALHGLTSEMDHPRCTSGNARSEEVSALALPPQNVTLYAEFIGLTRFLTHCGFPCLESVQLHHKEFEFVRVWERDLATRITLAQKQDACQRQAMNWLVRKACWKFEKLSSTYPQAQNDPGYQRIHGALKLLKKMAHESSRPEEVTGYLAALLQDMERLRKQFQRVAS